MKAPDEPTPFTIHFEQGVPVKLEVAGKVITGSLEIFKEANEIGRVNGIGRVDIVESRFIGESSLEINDSNINCISLTIFRSQEPRLLRYVTGFGSVGYLKTPLTPASQIPPASPSSDRPTSTLRDLSLTPRCEPFVTVLLRTGQLAFTTVSHL
jgi:hypothetical protein